MLWMSASVYEKVPPFATATAIAGFVRQAVFKQLAREMRKSRWRASVDQEVIAWLLLSRPAWVTGSLPELP